MQVTKILAATDLSTAADVALVEAHERAGATGSLLVCSARPTLPPLSSPGAPAGVPEVQRADAYLRCAHDAVTARVVACTGRSPAQFSVEILDDEPPVAIVKRAEAWAADLLVVGHRGVTGLSHVWLGGVAERIARLSPCPVLVARPRTGSGRIVAGTDFSDPALPAVHAACDEVRRTGGRVTLVHSIELPVLPASGIGFASVEVPVRVLDQVETDAQGRLVAALEACGVAGDCRVTRERAATALVRVAEEQGADLLVVGTRGRTGIPRVLLGSVAEAVVRSAGCSVLVVRLREGA